MAQQHIGKSPSYLVRNPHSYCFRLKVPVDLQKVVGKKELRYSLKTGYLGLAKSKARLWAGLVQGYFRSLREEIQLKKLSDQDIKYLSGIMFRGLAEKFEEARILGEKDFKDKLPTMLTLPASALQSLKQDLIAADHREAVPVVRDLLEKEGYEINEKSFEFKRLCREVIKNSVKWMEVESKRNAGDYSGDMALFQDIPSPKEPEPNTEQSPTFLEDLYEYYKFKKLEAEAWDAGTVRTYKPKFTAFLSFTGNVPVSSITKPMVIKYSKLLDVLPPKFTTLDEYKDLSQIDPDTLKGKHDKRLDVSTKRDYLLHLQSVFSFAEDYEYIDRNPVSGLIPPKKKGARRQREVFTTEDLIKIFDSNHYPLDGKKPSRFLVPILGLYTGCRLEEICQLYTEDVYQMEDIWVLDINDKKDKTIKNEPSERLVPLHPFITDELNFPQFVKQVGKKGHERVFYDLTKYNYKYGHQFSRWFSSYKKKVGIVALPQKKVFHSLRHNVADFLYKAEVTESFIEELQGRGRKTEGSKRYVKGHLVKDLYDKAVMKLNYKIDLSHLKNSKYVVKD